MSSIIKRIGTLAGGFAAYYGLSAEHVSDIVVVVTIIGGLIVDLLFEGTQKGEDQ